MDLGSEETNLELLTMALACGHDVHVVCLLIAAEALITARRAWAGTVVFLFQPAEEAGDGAKGMVIDGLYETSRHNCPIPDVVLGQHVAPIRAGIVTSKTGAIMSSSDSLKITIFGRGGHASMPHHCIDPIVIASHIVVRHQTIASRAIPPDEVAIITVGSIHAGEAENVICDHANFTVNIRTLNDEVRLTVLNHIQRVINAECEASFCDKPPQIEHHMSIPTTSNAGDVEVRLEQTMKEIFGQAFMVAPKSSLASEDFSILASSIGKPYCFWLFGGTDPDLWDSMTAQGKADKIPINHSAEFAPVIDPTLQTGGDAMFAAALTFLGPSPSS
jgi:amidohydrolase